MLKHFLGRIVSFDLDCEILGAYVVERDLYFAIFAIDDGAICFQCYIETHFFPFV